MQPSGANTTCQCVGVGHTHAADSLVAQSCALHFGAKNNAASEIASLTVYVFATRTSLMKWPVELFRTFWTFPPISPRHGAAVCAFSANCFEPFIAQRRTWCLYYVIARRSETCAALRVRAMCGLELRTYSSLHLLFTLHFELTLRFETLAYLQFEFALSDHFDCSWWYKASCDLSTVFIYTCCFWLAPWLFAFFTLLPLS